MDHAFPPPSPEGVFVHYALLAWLIALVVVFVWSLTRPPAGWELVFWLPGVGAVMLVILTVWFAVRIELRPTLSRGFSYAIAAIAVVAFVQSAVRLRRHGSQVPIGRVIMLTAVLAVPGLFMSCVVAIGLGAFRAPWAPRSNCASNMKQLGLALEGIHDDRGRFPGSDESDAGNPPLSWRVMALPWLDEKPLRNKYDDTKPWDDPANLEHARMKIGIWSCPSNFNVVDSRGLPRTDYLLVTGPQTIAPGGRGIPLDDITDGASETMLLVEAAGLNVVWTEPRDFDVATQPHGVNLPGDRPRHSPGLLSSYHRGGANSLFADGSVHFLPEGTDPSVLKALATATGGEDVGEW